MLCCKYCIVRVVRVPTLPSTVTIYRSPLCIEPSVVRITTYYQMQSSYIVACLSTPFEYDVDNSKREDRKEYCSVTLHVYVRDEYLSRWSKSQVFNTYYRSLFK